MFPRGLSQRAARAARLFPDAASAARSIRGLARALGPLPVAVLLLAGCAAADPPLPRLQVAPGRVAVLGLSSGGYQAAQAHLAFAERIDGAVIVSAGPVGCAGGDLGQALGPCMAAASGPPDVDALAARVRERAAQGALAPLSALAGDRVLVMHAADDPTVSPTVGRAGHDLYAALAADAPGLQLHWDGERRYGHSWPTLDRGTACGAGTEPWIGACGVDAAADAFAWLYGEAATPAAAEPTGELRRFDQRALAAEVADPVLADTGYLYLPPACAAGQPCGLLVAFHGCQQSAEQIGEAFVRDAGLNRWADAYQVAVLYPQTRSSYLPLNPKACWDWWGYTGADYDTRRGAQLRWLANALDALGAP